MRTEKMRIDNMEKVFKAAMTLFSKQNVTNTTLQMIADEAGVSTRSIVNYFNTRENLLLATHQRYIEYAFGELKKFCETEEYQKLNGRGQQPSAGYFGPAAARHSGGAGQAGPRRRRRTDNHDNAAFGSAPRGDRPSTPRGVHAGGGGACAPPRRSLPQLSGVRPANRVLA